MKRMRQIVALAEMFSIPVLRNPTTYATLFLLPAIFLYLYSLLGGIKLGEHVLLGSLVGFTMNTGIVSLPQKVVEYKLRHLQDVYVSSSVDEVTYLLGIGLSRLIYASPACLLFAIILFFRGALPVRAIPILVLVLLISWVSGCAIGFTLATYVTGAAQMSAVANILGLLLILVPPVFYPLEFIGPGWRSAALLIPSAGAAHLISVACHLTRLANLRYVLESWTSLAVCMVLCFWILKKKSRWTEK